MRAGRRSGEGGGNRPPRSPPLRRRGREEEEEGHFDPDWRAAKPLGEGTRKRFLPPFVKGGGGFLFIPLDIVIHGREGERRRGQNYGHLRGRGTEKGTGRRGRRNQDFGKRKGREGPRFMRSLLCHLEEESFSSMGNKVSH